MQLIRLAEDYSFGPFDCGEPDLRSMPGPFEKALTIASFIKYFVFLRR